MKRNLSGLVLLAIFSGVAWGGLHQDAATCRLASVLSADCRNNCMQCHEGTDPSLPLDIYVKGDERICRECHPNESLPGSGTQLLRLVGGGGGNHPVAILYSPEASRGVLIPAPSGPRLFTDKEGKNPKIYCSTCHDSMSSTVNLLRVNNRGSALCLSCHIK